jgi:anti-sigma-K factor RskA
MEQHVIDLLPAYALDALDPDEKRQVERHLQTCPACQVELQAFREAAGMLAYAARPAVPPERLKQALMRAVRPGQEPATRQPAARWITRLWQGFVRLSPGLAIAALVLVLALGAANLVLLRQTGQRAATQPFRVVALAGTPASPQANGLLVISATGREGTLIVDGLPQLDRQHQYQLWLIKDGQRTSGGVFSVYDEGYGAMVVDSPRPLSEYPAFGITIEPLGGSHGPTGEKVLGGEI